MPKKHPTNYPGVRYYTHQTRLCNRKPDQYFSIRYRTADGRQHEDGIGWASKGWTAKKAHDIMAALEGNITSGTGPQTLKELRGHLVEQKTREAERQAEESRGFMTFDTLADRYLEAKSKKKSIDDDRQRLRDHIRPEIGGMCLADIHHGHIKAIQTKLEEEKKLSPATIKQCLILIRSLYNFALKTPFDPANPSVKTFNGNNPFNGYEGMPKFNNRREAWFTEEQAQAILAAVEAKGGAFSDFVTLAMFTGMRRGEIASLMESDVVPETNSIIIRSDREKNSEGRVVFVPENIMAKLKGKMTGDGSRKLFPIHQDTVTTKFGEIMAELGLKSTNRRVSACFHTLRHTLITHLVMDGVPLSMVQDISGHKTFEMVRRYAKSAAPQAREAVSGFHRKMASPAPSEDKTHHHGGESPASD